MKCSGRVYHSRYNEYIASIFQLQNKNQKIEEKNYFIRLSIESNISIKITSINKNSRKPYQKTNFD